MSACSTTRILWRLQLPHDRGARNSAGTLAWIYCSTIAAAPHRQGTRCAHAGEVASSLSSTEAARGERTPASQPASKPRQSSSDDRDDDDDDDGGGGDGESNDNDHDHDNDHDPDPTTRHSYPDHRVICACVVAPRGIWTGLPGSTLA